MIEQKPINVSISLREAKCVEFFLTEYGIKNTNVIPIEKFEFEFKFESNLNRIEKNMRINFTTKLFEKIDANIKYSIGELKTSFNFVIHNLDEILIKNDKDLDLIPDQVMITIVSIVISTTRGMLTIKFENSLYSNALIPLVDAKILIPKKIENLS